LTAICSSRSYDSAICPTRGFPAPARIVEHPAELRARLDGDHDVGVPSREAPSREEVWLRYRASTAHGLTMWLVTAASDWQRLEVSLALAQRYAAAFMDLDGAAAIKHLAGGSASR
jgi:hypothetical protein